MAAKKLRQVTQQELTAARLREVARELMLQADALEAGILRPRTTKGKPGLIDPRQEARS